MNGQHTFVHELGHHFGMGRMYGGRELRAGKFHQKAGKLAPLHRASQRYEEHVDYLLHTDWNLSGYARKDT